jgi:hypothetical protein
LVTSADGAFTRRLLGPAARTLRELGVTTAESGRFSLGAIERVHVGKGT